MADDNLTVMLHKKGDLRLEQTPIPDPSDNEVLLAMQSVGICGSDIHYWVSGAIGDFVVKQPMILGHESSGRVIKVGAKVKHLKPGDRVAIEPGVPCRYCDYCKSGVYNLCPDVQFCATPPVDGTLRRYYTHAADFCFKLPDHVSFDEGALFEPLSVGVHACRRANVGVGKKVLITGSGPIGLVNLLVAKAMGAAKVCITDISESRLEFAKSLGADHVFLVKGNNSAQLASEVRETFGFCPDIAIECSGAELSIQLCLLAVRSGGIVVIVGLGPSIVNVPVLNALVREVDIRGVFRYANCYPISLELVESGKVDLKPLITHRFTLEESLKAFDIARSGSGIKVVIDCASSER